MESFNSIPLLILAIVLIFLLICIFLYMIIKKIKFGWLWLLSIIMIITGGVKIHDQILNSVFYDFKTEMCSTFPEINDIEFNIINGGSICTIDVDLKKEIEYERLENLFIDMLKKINQEPMSSYLKGSSNSNKHWNYLLIDFFGVEHGRFESEIYKHSDWFTNENQQEQTWKNSDTGKKYNYSDYIEY
ncbi:hypothetical protein RZO55_03715 [Clostridium boliviensis]|uniref:Uncharacterized protein n=1 Tax=Clostridium boliviensis TaxID=318465 RepID=A0ABU4GGD1_9CLOT|nr:hypothetical protein [Clostridium boliviensis]MDW2796685.1 hypothetical protein [Clostridium boliviensis]